MLHQYHKKEAGDDDDADVHIEEKSGEGDGEDEEAPPFWRRSNFEGPVLVCINEIVNSSSLDEICLRAHSYRSETG